MKCPDCKNTFDPWTAKRYTQGKKGAVIQCPHCLTLHPIGSGRRKK